MTVAPPPSVSVTLKVEPTSTATVVQALTHVRRQSAQTPNALATATADDHTVAQYRPPGYFEALASVMQHRAGDPPRGAAVDDAIARVMATGKPAGVFATAPRLVERWTALGASFVAIGVDIPLLAKATADLAATYRTS